MPDSTYQSALSHPDQHISLCEALDRMLTKGIVIRGDLVLSVANIDLVYLGLQAVLCSVDTAERVGLLYPSPVIDFTETPRTPPSEPTHAS